MSNPKQIAALAEKVLDEFGRLDILVNIAGIQHVAKIAAFPAEKWDAILAINLILFDRAATAHAERTDRFLAHRQVRAATHGRRGESAHERDAVLRQPRHGSHRASRVASGALPPAFPPIRIDGDLYWDGGILSNTPVEAIFEDTPRRDSLVFAVHIWNSDGDEPKSIWQVMHRQKEIQYSSRAITHIARQRQIHRLRHIIAELAKRVPESERHSARIRELAAYGCLTRMHVERLLAPRLDGEDHTKDIDFSRAGIRKRWKRDLPMRATLSKRPLGKPTSTKPKASTCTSSSGGPRSKRRSLRPCRDWAWRPNEFAEISHREAKHEIGFRPSAFSLTSSA
jgi:hypothetical protein